MAVTAKWYGQALMKVLNKEVDFDTDTIKVMLCTTDYSPDQDTHVYKTDITGESSGTGYTAGGATLANTTMSYTAASNVIKLDADDTVWSNSEITAYYAVIYDASPASSSARNLLGYVDFGENKTSAGPGTFTITWSTQGIFTITSS